MEVRGITISAMSPDCANHRSEYTGGDRHAHPQNDQAHGLPRVADQRAPVGARRLSDELAKHGGERASLVISHIERYLGNREVSIGKQFLGSLHLANRVVSVGRDSE